MTETHGDAGYATAQLDEIAPVDDGRGSPFRAVRHHFGIRTFGVNAMVAAVAGDGLLNEHDESEPESGEELYVVIAGHATFEFDGHAEDAPSGTFVHVAAGTKRTAFALEAGTTVLAVGAGPADAPYEVTGWELFAPLFPLFESEEHAEGAERGRQLIASSPSYSALFYNTACFEARAGQAKQAIEHLRRAVEIAPYLLDLVREDEDLASLHGDPRFEEMLA
jgi:quercetin dioxygenase-like cupin family protein